MVKNFVDHLYCFIDSNVGWSGSILDACVFARVFANSFKYKKIIEENLLPCRTLAIKGVNIPLFLLVTRFTHYRHG